MASRFLNSLKNYFRTSGPKNVTILGSKTAGKTTIVDQLIQKKILIERREETHGSKTRSIKIQLGEVEHDFKITDVGGSKQYQDLFWKTELVKADGIIYVIDTSLLNECEALGSEISLETYRDTDCPNYNTDNKIFGCGCLSNSNFRESREAKSFAFSILDKGKPILIFLNKQDLGELQQVYTQQEIEGLYRLDSVSGYNFKMFSGSALRGVNVFESVSWLFENME